MSSLTRSPQRLLSTIAVRTLLVLGISYVLLNLGIAIRNNYSTNQTIRTLKNEIAQLGEQIAFLGNKIVYLQSAAYRELEAKRRLGLRRIGEQVVLVASNSDGTAQSASKDQPSSLTVDRSSHVRPESWAERASVNAKTWVDWLLGR